MTKTPTKSETARRGLLAGLMLAVLVASVGIAWLLDRRSSGRVRAGTKIIHEIRDKGLGHYWSDELQIDWYLIYSKGNAIGWRASTRAKSADKTFIGVDVEVVPRQYSSHEIWTLNADVTVGTYHADFRKADSQGSRTDISMSDGVVRVVQHVPGRRVTASAQVTENYLPEGTLSLAVRKASEMRANAQFAMVFNEILNRGKIVEFGTLRLRYLGRGRTQHGQTVHRVRKSWGGKSSVVFELDEKGKILLIQGRDVQIVAGDEQAVKKSFEGAPFYLQRILMQALNIRGPARPHNPSE
ncbi:MAG: hypothetical protein K8R91_01910 [Phycisphaerae bacterium]|nr:hypothetical protein [Phycisphaerae bacterium]